MPDLTTDLTKQEERLLKLAERGGGDKELLILDEIDALERKFDETVKEIKTEFKEAVQEIKDNVPNLDKVLESVKGKDGKDSTVPGPKGDKGDKGEPGKNGKDGRDGVDGIDGVDGKSMNPMEMMEMVMAKMPDMEKMHEDMEKEMEKRHESMMEEMRSEMEEMKKKIKAIPERPTTTIFGPGKTRVILVDLSSQLDGSTKTFFIGSNFGVISVQGSSAPFGAFRPTVDYSEANNGRSIQFTANVNAADSLASGQSLIVKMLK